MFSPQHKPSQTSQVSQISSRAYKQKQLHENKQGIRLLRIEKFSIEDIAKITSISKNTIHAYLNTPQFKEYLAEYFESRKIDIGSRVRDALMVERGYRRTNKIK